MDELLAQFLIEAPELSAQASEDLLALEQTPDDAMRLDSAFRAVHTLKGSVGLFDFGGVAEEHAGALVTLAQSVAPHLIAAAEALSRLQEALAGAHEITRSDKALKSAYIVARSALAPLLQPTE